MTLVEVVDLAQRRQARRPEEPHIAGRGHCLACKASWAAVAPIGTVELECPACGLMRGVWTYPLAPPDEALVWQCNCGGTLFMLREGGPWCAGCGTYAAWPP